MASEPHVGEAEAVDDRGGLPVGLGGGHVVGVGREDLGVAVEEQVGGREEGGVLHLGGRRGQDPAGRLGAGAELGDRVRRHPGSVGPAARRLLPRSGRPGGRLWAWHEHGGAAGDAGRRRRRWPRRWRSPSTTTR